MLSAFGVEHGEVSKQERKRPSRDAVGLAASTAGGAVLGSAAGEIGARWTAAQLNPPRSALDLVFNEMMRRNRMKGRLSRAATMQRVKSDGIARTARMTAKGKKAMVIGGLVGGAYGAGMYSDYATRNRKKP